MASRPRLELWAQRSLDSGAQSEDTTRAALWAWVALWGRGRGVGISRLIHPPGARGARLPGATDLADVRDAIPSQPHPIAAELEVVRKLTLRLEERGVDVVVRRDEGEREDAGGMHGQGEAGVSKCSRAGEGNGGIARDGGGNDSPPPFVARVECSMGVLASPSAAFGAAARALALAEPVPARGGLTVGVAMRDGRLFKLQRIGACPLLWTEASERLEAVAMATKERSLNEDEEEVEGAFAMGCEHPNEAAESSTREFLFEPSVCPVRFVPLDEPSSDLDRPEALVGRQIEALGLDAALIKGSDFFSPLTSGEPGTVPSDVASYLDALSQLLPTLDARAATAPLADRGRCARLAEEAVELARSRWGAPVRAPRGQTVWTVDELELAIASLGAEEKGEEPSAGHEKPDSAPTAPANLCGASSRRASSSTGDGPSPLFGRNSTRLAVVKALAAAGTSASHALVTVPTSSAGARDAARQARAGEVPLPAYVQAHVPHAAGVIKVGVIGRRVALRMASSSTAGRWGGVTTSIHKGVQTAFAPETASNSACEGVLESACANQSASPPVSAGEPPPLRDALAPACALACAFSCVMPGVRLFGFDLLYDASSREYCVIDVNHLPSYGGWRSAGVSLADVVREAVGMAVEGQGQGKGEE